MHILGLLDGDDAADGWQAVLERAFNARLQRDIAARATDAGALETHLHDALGSHIHKFHVTAVGLYGRPDQLQHARDLGLQLTDSCHGWQWYARGVGAASRATLAGMNRPLLAALATAALVTCGRTISNPAATLMETGRPTSIHVECMELLDASVGLRDQHYRDSLHQMLWRAGYTNDARQAALDRLWVVDKDGVVRTIRQRLPRMSNWTWLAQLCGWIADRGITELDEALISSWSRPTNHVQREEDRPEYAALAAMHSEDNIVDRIFKSFLESSRAWQEGYRTRCWELLHRLNERPRLVALLASASSSEDPLLDDLRHGAAELGIVPRNREEILWMRAIRDPKAREQWKEAVDAVADMSDLRRLDLELRDVPVAIAARRHAPELLLASTNDMLEQIANRVRDRRHYFETEGGGLADTREELFRHHRAEMTWGDAAAILLALRAMETPQVVAHFFDYAQRDLLDDTTEYGGVLALDAKGRFELIEFMPRIRQHDRRFNAPQEMLDRAYWSLFHFHFHAQRHRNGDHAGPGMGDKNYANNTRANCLVLTFVNEDTMNVDFYRHGHVIADLGTIERRR